jgi:S-adenosylmethionine hydrolase
VPSGRPVAVVNSWDHLEIAVRDGSAAATLGAGVGDEVVVA